MHALRLYGHRGAPLERPENTMLAFRRALDLGADALELDVHLTRDGHPIVSHDPTAARMANVPARWKDLDLAETRTIDVGWGFVAADGSRPFAGRGFRVPTLEELIVELPAVALNIDMKQLRPPMVERTMSLVRRLGADERVVFASFHWRTLLAIRARGHRETALSIPEALAVLSLPRMLLARAPLFGTCAQLPERLGHYPLTRRAVVDKCHALGLRLDYWTIDDPALAGRLLDLGADGIMTNDPRALAPVFAARRGQRVARAG